MMCETITGSNHPSFGSLSFEALERWSVGALGLSKSIPDLLAIPGSRVSRLETKEGIMLYMLE